MLGDVQEVPLIKQITSSVTGLASRFVVGNTLSTIRTLDPYSKFIERAAILGLVSSRIDSSDNRLWSLTDKGRQLLLRLEHPDVE